MNVRPDMLRQQGIPQLPQNMLTLNSQQFGPSAMPQNQMNGLLANGAGVNPPMGMLGGGQPNHNIVATQRHQAQLQHIRQQQALLQQAQHAQSVPSAPGSHMGPGPGQSQIQNMGFPGNMMPHVGNNPPIRRVSSQSQGLNQAGGHMSGLHPGQTGGIGGMGAGMNSQATLPNQLRQAAQQPMGVRIQQSTQSHVSPEMAMGLTRQGNAGMAQNVARSTSAQAQLMGSLSQPPALTQAHPGGMQPSLPQTNFQNPMSLPHQHQQPRLSSSPRPGAHPQSHTPSNMSMSTPVPPQGAPNRSRMTPDNPIFVNFQNSQTQIAGYNPPRLSGSNSQFPFPSSASPTQHGEIPPTMSDGLGNPGGSSNRPSSGFLTTPAQQIEQMRDYGSHYNMPPPQSNPPPRPPSHNTHHPAPPLPQMQQPPQHHHSPHSSDHMNIHPGHPQRPQSQPQAQPGRPPSQGGHIGTPHVLPPQLPNQGLLPSARISSSSQPPQIGPHTPHQSQSSTTGAISIPPRPQNLLPSAGPSGPPPTLQTPESGQPVGSRSAVVTVPVGLGQGLVRLLQFSGLLANKNKNKLQLSFWKAIVDEYFTPKAVMKFTLWKDNQRNEAKPFEIGVPILPRFFLVTSQAGVESMTLSLDGARERLLGAGHAVVECVTAVWTYKYSNGYKVTLRGPLTAHVLIVPNTPLNVNGSTATSQQTPQQSPFSLKFENLQFDANLHDKFISLESIMGQRATELQKTPHVRNAPTPTANGTTAQQRAEEDKKWEEPRITIESASIPGEPVNAFGIPQATMRCLELAESVGQMAELISFSNEHSLGPIEALAKFAASIRDSPSHMPGQAGAMGHINGVNNPGGGGSFTNFPNVNGVSVTPAVTLYSGAPSSIASSNPQPGPSIASPQNAPMSAESSPQRQNKPNPQPPQASGSAVAVPQSTSASATPSSGPHTTPLMANASLKRKQGAENASPTTANAEQPPPAKRLTRKRGRTAGGG